MGNETQSRTGGSLHTPISIDSRSKAIPIRIFFSLRPSISFLDSSVGKESACNAGDPSSIPGSGRSPGEGIGYALQYPWASLVAQLVKSPPAKQEIWVQSLGCEDPLEEGKTTHSSILAWRVPWTVQSTESQRVGQDWLLLSLSSGIVIKQVNPKDCFWSK